jgi:small-conductance mechanosensitive channel
LLANKTLMHLEGAVNNNSDYKAETAKESKRWATKLYQWLRPPNRDYLVANDFAAYLDDPEDVKKLVGMLNRRSGDIVAISEADLRRVIESILQERFGLAKSMQSIETALGRIDGIFSFAVFFSAAILLALLFTGVGESLTALTAFVSALSFVFASSAGQLFESIVFLLIIHPFDVGDRVYIALGTNSIPPFGEVGMDNLLVSSMHVLSTEFERWDGVKVYVPNYVLANRPIFNVRRSGPINDFLRIQIDYNTPTERIAEFRRRVDTFCKKESADFTGYSRVNIEYMENCNRLGMFVVVQHRTNWQDYDLQLARRTKVFTFVKAVLDELAVGYLPPLQRVAMVQQ